MKKISIIAVLIIGMISCTSKSGQRVKQREGDYSLKCNYWLESLNTGVIYTQEGPNAFNVGDTIDVLMDTTSTAPEVYTMARHRKQRDTSEIAISYIVRTKKLVPNGK